MATPPMSTMLYSTDNPANMTNYEYQYLEEEDYIQFVVCTKENVRAFGKVFLPVLYTIVFLLGLTGNCLLFAILIKYTKNKKMTEVYLLNLTVSDLLFVITLPFWATYAASQWVFGNAFCKIISIIYSINFYSGIFFVSCMSLDKYLEIVHAWSNKNLRAPRKSFFISSLVWVLSILLSIPECIFVQVQDLHNGRQVCHLNYGPHHFNWKLLFQFQQILLGFFLPFLCMVFFYSRVACVLTELRSTGKKKALRLVVTLVVVFFVLWFPYNVTLFLHLLQHLHVIKDCETSKHLDYALQVTECLAFIHCCLNPLLYAFVNKRFRLHLKKIFGAVFRQQDFFVPQVPETNNSSSRSTDQVEMTNFTTP
nr:atypical chemokine receptor 2 [Pelodiscus sinensis]XP_025039125.1 atypical chemokine receptor 2 [Pelodiscus sinensis]|eukprot:XP_006120680.1 atypical chemokine receptor 2 [Pelodiscus sinensis]